MYPDLNKICRICLQSGSRPIFSENNKPNSQNNHLAQNNTSSLDKIAEKLRFVLMLKVHKNENLPTLICDLCIVQLNVSYNFKKLALKNDFNIRQFLIENGMNLTKNIDEMNNIEMNENTTTTALEIHQIVRTNRRYRAAPPDPISHISETASASVRRNSTLSSASATSTFQNTRDNNNSTPMMREDVARFVLPKPIFRPMLIKVEPIDEDNIEKITTPETSTTSPSASSGLASSDVVTVNSSIPSNSPPMVVINRANMNKTQSNDTWRSQETNKQLHQESSSDVHRFQAIKTSIEDPDKKEKRVYIKSKLKSDYLITTRAQKIKSATPQRVSSRSATKLSLSPTKKSKLNLKKTETNSIKSSRPRGRPRKKSKLDRS